MIGRSDNQLSPLTADDIMDRYPEVRADVGDLSWMQIKELVNTVGVHCKEHPRGWTTEQIKNLNMFMRDFVYGRHRGLLVTLFQRVTLTRDMHNFCVWHKGEDTMELVNFANAVIHTPGFRTDTFLEDPWATAVVDAGGDPADWHKAGSIRNG